VPKSVGSFLAVDQKFLNEFKLIELVLRANSINLNSFKNF
jgi:hypothetical protein